MKKKWLSCLAIGFAACFAFGAVGCGEDQTGGGAQSEEQVYNSFKSAYQSTLNYTGAITLTGTYENDYLEDGDQGHSESGMTFSLDQQAGMGYFREWNTYGGVTEEWISRVAAYNDGYVMQEYSKAVNPSSSSSEPEVETDSYILSDVEYAAFANASWTDYSEIDLEDLAAVAELNSFTTYKDALANVNAMIAEVYQENEVDGSCTMSVSAKTENGAQVIETATQIEIKEDGEAVMQSQTTKLYAKGGKLIKFVMEDAYEMKANGEVYARYSGTMEINLDYKFDQAGYDAAADKLDTTSTPREKDENDYLASFDVDMYINGEKLYNSYARVYGDDTADSVMSQLMDNSVVNAYEIENWYIDEACTQVFEPTEVKDFVGVDALYTKNATVKDGYALVFYREATELTFSEEDLYRVFGAMATYENDWECDVLSDNGEYDLTQHDYYENADKIKIDSDVTDNTVLNYQAGNMYFVEYVKVETDETILREMMPGQ